MTMFPNLVNIACGFNQSEIWKYFELIIMYGILYVVLESKVTVLQNVLFQKISIPLPWKVFQIEPRTSPEIPF